MVTVYTKNNCPQCKFLKILLKNKNVDFVEVGEEDSLLAGVTSFPQIDYNNHRMTYPEAYNYFNKEHA